MDYCAETLTKLNKLNDVVANSINTLNHNSDALGIDINKEDFMCAICHELLLNPVLASDGAIYGEDCYKEYIKDKYNVRSPLKGITIDTKYTKIDIVKNIILKLLEKTVILDECIEDMNYECIVLNDLEDILT